MNDNFNIINDNNIFEIIFKKTQNKYQHFVQSKPNKSRKTEFWCGLLILSLILTSQLARNTNFKNALKGNMV